MKPRSHSLPQRTSPPQNTADEGQRVLRAATIKAREIAAKQEQIRAARVEQQKTRRELRSLVRTEVNALVNTKFANAKKREKNKHDALQRKIKALQDSVNNLGELEQQLEELRTDQTDSMEEQEVCTRMHPPTFSILIVFF